MKKLIAVALVLAGCSSEVPPPPQVAPPPADPAPAADFRLQFTAPPEWKRQEPASKLRKAQYAIPDRDKVEADAEMVYFGLAGGSLEANLERWKGQFRKREGEPKVEKLEGATRPVTLVELAGDYSPDMGGAPQSDALMLVAIVETPEGTHFFKAIGPRGTVGDWKDAFVTMVKGSRWKE